MHQDRIVRGVRAQPMKARAAVEEALRSIDRTGQLVVKESRRIVEPLRNRRLGVRDAVRQHAAIGDGEHVQRRILASVPRQSVHDVSSVGRCLPPIHGPMPAARHERGGIDQHPVTAAAAHEQLEVVGARGPLLNEGETARALNLVGQHRVAGHLLNACEQRGTPGKGVEDGAGMPVLTFEERQPISILVVLHPAVWILERLAEIGIANDLDPRHGCGRHPLAARPTPHGRHAIRRRVRRGVQGLPEGQGRARERTGGGHQKAAPIKEFAHSMLSWLQSTQYAANAKS